MLIPAFLPACFITLSKLRALWPPCTCCPPKSHMPGRYCWKQDRSRSRIFLTMEPPHRRIGNAAASFLSTPSRPTFGMLRTAPTPRIQVPTSPFPIFCGNRPDTFSTYVHLHENPEQSRSLRDEYAARSAPLHWQCCILNTSYSIRRGAHFLKLWPNSTERIKFHYSRVRKRVKLDTIVFILG